MGRSLILALAVAALGAAQTEAPPNPKEIIRKSLSKDDNNRALLRQYTYTEHDLQREFDGKGHEKSSESRVYDITMLYGRQFRRLIQKDGRPLSAKEEEKQKERLDKFSAKWGHETPQEQAKRKAAEEKERREGMKYLDEVADAYNFQALPDETIGGLDTWVFDAEPRPGYRPKLPRAKYFTKIRGRIWINKADYQWVKLEAETLDTISLGWVLMRLFKGSRIEFEQTRVNDEIWLPRRAHFQAAGRLGVFLKASLDSVITYENYRKFQSESTIRVVP